MPELLPAPLIPAAKWVPSADEAMACQAGPVALGAPESVQVLPLFVEIQIPPPLMTAANRVPSAEEAMEFQYPLGALVTVQLVPAAPRNEGTGQPVRLNVKLVAGRTIEALS